MRDGTQPAIGRSEPIASPERALGAMVWSPDETRMQYSAFYLQPRLPEGRVPQTPPSGFMTNH